LVVLSRILSGAKRLWCIPLLFIIWANVHGGWTVGLGMLAVWSAGELFWRGPQRRFWMLTGVTALSALAILVNPYGFDLWRFTIETVGVAGTHIQEWQPLWRDTPSSWLLWIGGIAFFLWNRRALLSQSDGGFRAVLSPIGCITMLAVGAMLVNRLVPLFVPVMVTLVGPLLKQQGAVEGVAIPRERTLFDIAVTAAVVIVLAVVRVLSPCISIEGNWAPDLQAAAALRAADAKGRLISWYDWGEYAIWHLSPALKVSLDGRYEETMSRARLREEFAIAEGDPEGLVELGRLTPEYVWLPQSYSSRTKAWLREHGYRIDVDTPESFVAVRPDLPVVAPVSISPSGCFPGP
jgi:hypothetical protein